MLTVPLRPSTANASSQPTQGGLWGISAVCTYPAAMAELMARVGLQPNQ